MARYIDTGEVANATGLQVRKALLGLHLFTGCDSVSAFCKHWQIKTTKGALKEQRLQGRVSETCRGMVGILRALCAVRSLSMCSVLSQERYI